MPAPRIIDHHRQREEIEFALVNGVPFAQAAEHFGIHERTLSRHLADMLRDRPEHFRRLRVPGLAPQDVLIAAKRYAHEHRKQLLHAAEAAFHAVSK